MTESICNCVKQKSVPTKSLQIANLLTPNVLRLTMLQRIWYRYFTRLEAALMRAVKMMREKPIYNSQRTWNSNCNIAAVKKAATITEAARRVERKLGSLSYTKVCMYAIKAKMKEPIEKAMSVGWTLPASEVGSIMPTD